MLSLALLLALSGPEADPPVSTTPEASEADQSAWGSVGWGDASEGEGDAAPSPESKDTPPAQSEGGDSAASSEPGEREPDEAGWDAAGWGDPEPSEPEATPSENPVEGPAPETSEDDWSNWAQDNPEEDAGPSETEVETSKRKTKVGDVLTGSLRLTGSFLHFDDEPALFPAGDDALVLTVGRVLVEADVGEHLHFSFNGFGELSRLPAGAGSGGNFASAGSTASAYRTRYLAWSFWDDGSAGGQIGVERASMRLSFDPVNIEIGRFPITYTVAGGLTTNDFFAPFSATAVNTIYKPGVDAIRVSTGVGPTSSVDVVGVLGYNAACNEDLGPANPCLDDSYKPNIPTWGRSAVLARAATVGLGFEWAALGGKVSQRWVAGGSLQGGIGPVNLHAEFHVGIPDEDGDGHDSTDKAVYGRVSAGPNMIFAWQNASISAEYLYASDGAGGPSGYLTRAFAGYSDDLPYLGQHYVSAAYSMEIIPILRFAVSGVVSATDGSGLAGISFFYNVADESDLILGVFVPWGKGARNIVLDDSVDPAQLLSFDLGSEFGLAPLSAYLEARVFF